MDARHMSFEEESFSCVIDKGTTDAIMSDPSGEGVENVRQIFTEVRPLL